LFYLHHFSRGLSWMRDRLSVASRSPQLLPPRDRPSRQADRNDQHPRAALISWLGCHAFRNLAGLSGFAPIKGRRVHRHLGEDDDCSPFGVLRRSRKHPWAAVWCFPCCTAAGHSRKSDWRGDRVRSRRSEAKTSRAGRPYGANTSGSISGRKVHKMQSVQPTLGARSDARNRLSLCRSHVARSFW